MDERGAALQRIRNLIERLARDGSAVSTRDGSVHSLFPVAVSPIEGEMLRRWVVHERAAQTIEVGLGYGISTLYICEGLLANADAVTRHVAIDPIKTHGSRTVLCSFSTRRASRHWSSTARKNRRLLFLGFWPRAGGLTLPSSMETIGSMASSST